MALKSSRRAAKYYKYEARIGGRKIYERENEIGTSEGEMERERENEGEGESKRARGREM